MKDNELDDLFKRSLENKEITPSNHVWQNIKHDLNNGNKIIPIKKSNKKWYGYSIAASVALLIGLSALFILKKENPILENKSIAKIEETNDKNITSIEKDKIESQVVLPKATKESLITTNKSIIRKTANKYKSFNQQKENIDIDIQLKEVNTKKEAHIALAEPVNMAVKPLGIDQNNNKNLSITMIQPMIPTVDSINNEKELIASKKPKHNLLSKFLNAVTSNIDIAPVKDLLFSNDEEGTIQISIKESYAKNKN